MSKYSGKCDVYDCYSDYSDDRLKQSKFYISTKDGRVHLLKIESQKDLAKYYPYLTSMAYGEKDGGAVVIITSTSFIDREEKEFLDYDLKALLKYYKKCKRNKIEFNDKEAADSISWFGDLSEAQKRLIQRVKKQGEKATTDGLHRPMQEYYRKEWFECLIDFGYEEFKAREIVYGWERAVQYEKSKKEASKETQGKDTES